MLSSNSIISLSLEQVLKGIKLALFVAILVYMGYKIGTMKDFLSSQKAYFQSFCFSQRGLYLFTAFILLPFNILFEALKWKEVTKGIASISIIKSSKGVITGQALNLILPANLGHFAGRLVNLEESGLRKIQVISLVSICQASQMAITFLAFIIGTVGLGSQFLVFQINFIIAIPLLLAILFILILAYLQIRKLAYFQEILNGFKLATSRQVAMIVIYSFFRYIIFSTQFILVLYFLDVSLPWHKLAMGLSLVFMAKSLMPSFNFLSDLGVREFAALLVLPSIGLPETVVIAGSLWVWGINIFLPSLIGTFILLKSKLNYLFC